AQFVNSESVQAKDLQKVVGEVWIGLIDFIYENDGAVRITVGVYFFELLAQVRHRLIGIVRLGLLFEKRNGIRPIESPPNRSRRNIFGRTHIGSIAVYLGVAKSRQSVESPKQVASLCSTINSYFVVAPFKISGRERRK